MYRASKVFVLLAALTGCAPAMAQSGPGLTNTNLHSLLRGLGFESSSGAAQIPASKATGTVDFTKSAQSAQVNLAFDAYEPLAAKFDASVNDGGVNFGTRLDAQASWGYNCYGGGGRVNSSEPSAGFTVESFWPTSLSNNQMEQHIFFQDPTDVQHRVFTSLMSRQAPYGTSCALGGQTVTISDDQQVTALPLAVFDTVNAQAKIQKTWSGTGTGTPPLALYVNDIGTAAGGSLVFQITYSNGGSTPSLFQVTKNGDLTIGNSTTKLANFGIGGAIQHLNGYFAIGNSAGLSLNNSWGIQFSSTSNESGAKDASIFRRQAGWVQVGSGNQDSTGGIIASKHATSSTTVFWSSGTGAPNGVVTADVGSLYTRTDGGANTTLYVKESGTGTNTGWVAK